MRSASRRSVYSEFWVEFFPLFGLMFFPLTPTRRYCSVRWGFVCFCCFQSGGQDCPHGHGARTDVCLFSELGMLLYLAWVKQPISPP